MKRILSTRRSRFMALGLAVAVLGATRWLPDHAGSGGDYGLAEAAAVSGDTGLGAAAERPARRIRASSTMPYFSFAQSLRSRG
ncbi:hypothetical protein [Pseudoxanthomonas koreensis]|uniref:hypothetical protein n=1 Tax=Pseudoxanthomonas koreensis TaxID=266061 RepID=UPI00139120C8|nr:hypothetical protein [Pseudoxanthomonas koreensis]KAF1697774.1 hypothetical protein CSC64_00775 [Pseudoxanthomonas koreensis]